VSQLESRLSSQKKHDRRRIPSRTDRPSPVPEGFYLLENWSRKILKNYPFLEEGIPGGFSEETGGWRDILCFAEEKQGEVCFLKAQRRKTSSLSGNMQKDSEVSFMKDEKKNLSMAEGLADNRA